MDTIAIIPARGGSKGIPKKNISNLGGKPLLYWTIQQAKEARNINEVFVSTDSEDIVEIAERYGARCDFLRPTELAGDKIGANFAVKYTLEKLSEAGEHFDYVFELQPTYCFRKPSSIEQALEILKKNMQTTSVISCELIQNTSHPSYVMNIHKDGMLKFGEFKPDKFARQSLSAAYAAKGVVLASRTDSFIETGSFYSPKSMPLVIKDSLELFDIDTPHDLKLANLIINESVSSNSNLNLR